MIDLVPQKNMPVVGIDSLVSGLPGDFTNFDNVLADKENMPPSQTYGAKCNLCSEETSDHKEKEAARFMAEHMKSILAKEIVENKVVEVTFYKETWDLILKRPIDPVVTLGKPILVQGIKSTSEAYKPLMETYSAGLGKCATPSSRKSNSSNWLLCEINGNSVSNMSYQRVLGLIRHGQRPSVAKFKPMNSKKEKSLYCPICCRYACRSRAPSNKRSQFCAALCAKLLGSTTELQDENLEQLMWSAPLGGYQEFDMNIEKSPEESNVTANEWWNNLYSRLQLLADGDGSKKGGPTWLSMSQRGCKMCSLSVQGSRAEKTFSLAGARVYCYATSSTPWSVKDVSLMSKEARHIASPRVRKVHSTSLGSRRHTRDSHSNNGAIKHNRKAKSDVGLSLKNQHDFRLVNFDDDDTSRGSSGSSMCDSSRDELHLKDIPRSASARNSEPVKSIHLPPRSKSARSSEPIQMANMISPPSTCSRSSATSTDSVRSLIGDDLLVEQAQSFHHRKVGEKIANMPSKAHKLLIGENEKKTKSNRVRRWSLIRSNRKALVFVKVAKIMRKRANTPALNNAGGRLNAKNTSTRSALSGLCATVPTGFLDEGSDTFPDSTSEPCLSTDSISILPHGHDQDLTGVTSERKRRDRKQMTVAVLLPKCSSLKRAQGKVILLRVRTKKEASNLTTTIKRNITTANSHLLLEACREDNLEQLREVLDEMVSDEDVQPIRKGGCCEAVGKQAIEEAIKRDNVEILKRLLSVLHTSTA